MGGREGGTVGAQPDHLLTKSPLSALEETGTPPARRGRQGRRMAVAPLARRPGQPPGRRPSRRSPRSRATPVGHARGPPGRRRRTGSRPSRRRNIVRLSRAAAAPGAAAAVAAYRRRRPATTWPARWRWSPGHPAVWGCWIATELARRGCRLLLCARDGAELERAADRLRSTGAEVAAVACDVTREESAGQLVDAARERYGGWTSWSATRASSGSGRCSPLARPTTRLLWPR